MFEEIFKHNEENRLKLSRLTKEQRNILEAIKPHVQEMVINHISLVADSVIASRLERLMKEVHDVSNGKVKKGDKEYLKFTTAELLEIFNGWFTLRYVFSVENGDDTETDFYACSKDYSGCDKKDMPERNQAIFKKFGIDTYGLTIIAPTSAFA